MKVIGLDLSLTSTGIAVITDHGTTTHTIETGPRPGLRGRCHRLNGITALILDYVRPHCDLAVIEAPAFDSRTGHQHDRSGLWWTVVTHLIGLDIPVVEVTTGGVKKYATGKGNCSKDRVLAAVIRRYADVEVDGNDQADALVLAAMGARALGAPIEVSLPAVNLAAMGAVSWPELVAA